MKKLIINIILFCSFFHGNSQTYNLVDNKGVVRSGKLFSPTDSGNIISTLTRIGNYLFPKNTTDSFGIGITTPVKPFQVGNAGYGMYYDTGYLNIGSSNRSRAVVSINRQIIGLYTNGHHGFEDHDSINSTGSPFAYFSYDDQHEVYGAQQLDHNGGIQIRNIMSGTSSIATRWDGFNVAMINNTSGNLALVRGGYIGDLGGTSTGNVPLQIGLDIASQTKGGVRFAFRSGLGAFSVGDSARFGKGVIVFENLSVGTTTIPTLPKGITIKAASVASYMTAGSRMYNAAAGGGGAGIDFGSADDSTRCGRFGVMNDGTWRSFVWLTAGGTSAQAEVMRLKGNGFLGIGTNSPDSMLTVTGGLKFSGLYRSTSAADSMLVINPTTGAIKYKTVPAGGTDTSGAALYSGIFYTPEATMSGSATWGGGTPPTGETAKFSWTQNVATREVSVKFYLSYSVIGATNTSVVIPWQSGLPNPVEHAGLTAASQVLYLGMGVIQGSETTPNTLVSKSYLRRNAADNAYEFLVNTTSASGKFVIMQLTYDY